MRLITLLGLGASVLACGPLSAQEEVLRGPVPNWVAPSDPLPVPENPEGSIFFRYQDSIVRLHPDGQDQYVGQRVKILHSQALQIGNIQIVWNPAAGAPTVHHLRINRDDEIIDVLEKSEFEVLRREDQLEQAMLDGLLTASLRVPDLRIGDELAIAFTVPSHDPTLAGQSSGLLALAPAPPPGRFGLQLLWDEGQQPNMKLTPDFEKVAQYSNRGLALTFDNPSIATPPKDAPPRFNWMRIVEYSDFADWPAVSSRFDALFRKASAVSPGSPVAEEAARIAAKHSGSLDRAKAALDLVQRQVRYVYVGLNGGNYAPASASETWQRRYGDCKGKTALLLALLNELDIEAEAVLASNGGADDGLDQRLPNPGIFDHVLVRATIDGEPLWMDGTLPAVAGASERPLFDYRYVLSLSEVGKELSRLTIIPAEHPQEMGINEIDARAGFDAPARRVQTILKRGIEGLQEYQQFSAVTKAQLTQGFRSALVGSEQWDTVDEVSYRFDDDTGASILKITGTGPVDWETDGSERYLTLPGGGFNPPSRRQRGPNEPSNVPFYTEPTYSCYATTIHLPDDTDVESWGFNTVFSNMMYGREYYRMMEKRDDRTIRMVRGAKTRFREISTDRAADENERLSDFDNSMAIVTYDPTRTMEAYGELRSVPSPWEIDWTTDDTHCLPPAVKIQTLE